MTEWYEDDEFWESFAPYFFTAWQARELRRGG